MITPVILSGGSGKRLWPASRQALPKQLISLYNEQSLLQNTLEHLKKIPRCNDPILVVNRQHHNLVVDQLAATGFNQVKVIYEPEGRNTAPAITAAAIAAIADDPEAKLLVLPIDHCFIDFKPFVIAVEQARAVADSGYLVTFGVTVQHPSTEFGYINAGAEIGSAYRIQKFLEKPNFERAQEFYRSGDYYWNSGIFLFRAMRFLQEVEALSPEVYRQCELAWQKAKKVDGKCYLDAEAFANCPSISIDYAVMEKTKHGAVIPTEARWFDIGNWRSLYDYSDKDSQNNVICGDVVAHDCHNSYFRSENRLLTAIGMNNCVVVETKDVILVSQMDRLSQLPAVIKSLDEKGREEVKQSSVVYCRWGHYQRLEVSDELEVSRVVIRPKLYTNKKTRARIENWLVITGRAKIIKEGITYYLEKGESMALHWGDEYYIENEEKSSLRMIRTQIDRQVDEIISAR